MMLFSRKEEFYEEFINQKIHESKIKLYFKMLPSKESIANQNNSKVWLMICLLKCDIMNIKKERGKKL